MSEGQSSRILRRVDLGSRDLVERVARLNRIAVALSAERDLGRLLGQILAESRHLTGADSGSIFVREDLVRDNPGATAADEIHIRTPMIALKVAQNESIAFPFNEMKLPLDHRSIAGHVALSGQVLHIADAYRIPASAPYTFSTEFDRKTGYRCKSMLVMPMRNRDGEIIGVIQLINKKKDPTARLDSADEVERTVVEFDEIDEELAEALASQAAVCVEKTLLYDEVQRSFDAMVESFTHAMERRNRTTYGHCARVAGYAEAIARAINDCEEPPFDTVEFSEDQLREIRYAALLHDIGKLAVPEAVLDKQNKLTDDRMEAIRYRFVLAMTQAPDDGIRRPWLQEAWAFVRRVNVPRERLGDEEERRLQQIAAARFADAEGVERPLLEAHEVEHLSVRRGNLTGSERKIIERHIVDTWEMLRRVPWPRHLARIPNFAAAHHEKIDGSGYPWGLKGDRIPLVGKILAMVDIYEALTAKDRPYKPAMPIDQALSIVEAEVKAGKLDPDLYRLFVSKNIYRLYSDDTGMIRSAC
jgi:HD-GYP domain-containing protein (c-di-GMP phosphodiesterase class II)